LILTVPFGIVGIVGLTQGQMGGIFGLVWCAGGIAASVSFFQVRLVISPNQSPRTFCEFDVFTSPILALWT
jgi:hypothetical protein